MSVVAYDVYYIEFWFMLLGLPRDLHHRRYFVCNYQRVYFRSKKENSFRMLKVNTHQSRRHGRGALVDLAPPN